MANPGKQRLIDNAHSSSKLAVALNCMQNIVQKPVTAKIYIQGTADIVQQP